jgi:hypothetical protein
MATSDKPLGGLGADQDGAESVVMREACDTA